MDKKFYTTTPLYYVNDKPHLGTAYSTIMANCMNQFRKLLGFETLFLTGVDEHGQKIQQTADKKGIHPKEHCDEYTQNFLDTWKRIEIDYDIFYRTTDAKHVQAVQNILEQLYAKGDIYSQDYEGWYCVSDEVFYPEEDLINGLSPTGKAVEKVSEKNYFFKMSKYQKRLIEHIKTHPGFIQPETKCNEVLGFLSKPLEDLSISRPKTRIHWGVELPFDKSHVTYVWVDALSNYLIATGYPFDELGYKKWWQDAKVQHIIGKDILITHCVYWTTLLLALDVKLPDEIFAHGWILNKDQAKMSKSSGEILDPLALIDSVGLESFKYYMASEIRFGNDAPFSEDLVIQKVNSDLANTLGNLLSRSTNLIAKFFDKGLPAGNDVPHLIKEEGLKLYKQVETHILSNEPHLACHDIIAFLKNINQYVEENAPWKQAKTDKEAAGVVLRNTLEALRISASLLHPILPKKMDQLVSSINYEFDEQRVQKDLQTWYALDSKQNIEKAAPLFPRI